MRRFSRGIRGGLAALALGAGAATTGAEEADNPRGADGGGDAELPLRGEIAGGAKIAALPDLGIAWKVELAAEGLVLSSMRPGWDLAVALRPTGGGAWRWSVSRGALDLSELWPMLRAKAGAAAEGWSASGRIELAGEGTWSPEAGPAGEVRLALREGWARSDELEFEMSGVELDLRTSDFATGTLAGGQALRISKVAMGNLFVTELEARFGLRAAELLEVERIAARIFGGRFQLKPVSIPLSAPSIDASAELEGVSISELARLAPQAVSGGEGSLSGRVRLTWGASAGLEIKTGALTVKKSAGTSLRLAPQPGFLTASLPPWLAFLSPKLVKDLKGVELGVIPLAVDSLEVVFNPDGPDGQRTAQIRVEGRPAEKSSVRSLRLEVNLSGDLTRVLMLGLNDQVSLEF